jgi:ribosomal-protein-alanine N-acetyltransferase
MKTKRPLEVHIRWMVRSDMAEVLEIEELQFEYPWTEDQFIAHLRKRNVIAMVATWEGKVVGFMLYAIHPTHYHIESFAVNHGAEGRGVGRQMVEKLAGKLTPAKRTRLTIDIWERNLHAQNFFKAMGFTSPGILRGYFNTIGEDAYAMELYHPDAVRDEELETSH